MVKFLLILTCTLTSSWTWAWGAKGHRIVAEIAQRHLNAKTKLRLSKILKTETLADVSHWADLMRSDPHYAHLAPWHYVSIPDGMTYEDSTKNPKGDVVQALSQLALTLKDPRQSAEKRLEALKLAVHFIGDFHQPLHVGRSEDAGGNTIKLEWFRTSTNLHEIWDEKLVEMEGLSYTEYTEMLDRASRREIRHWKHDPIKIWIQEAMNLRPLIYSYQELIDKPAWEYNYRYKVRAALHEQLLKGGVRLAAWLEGNLK